MRRRTSSVLALLLIWLVVCSSAASAQLRFGGATNKATAELLLNTDNLQPGQQAIAAVVVKIRDGYHSQSSQPLDEGYKPFVVSLDAGPNVTVSEALYPKYKLEHIEALGGDISVFSGTVVTFVPIEVKADAQPGEVELTATVNLQICNDVACDPPAKITVKQKTAIVAKGSPQKTTNGETFKQFDAMKFLHVHPMPTTQRSAEAATQTAAPSWTPYTPEALAAARAGGKPVILEFTAAWCVNCHVVERVVYGDAATLDELGKRGVTLIKVDLTDDGAPGSDILAKYNPARSIPFTAVYFPGKEEPSGITGIYSSKDLFATLDDAGNTKTSTTAIFGYELKDAPLPLLLAIAAGVGILLNAVPCVLPVLPLKAMSFYEDAGHSRGRSIANGAIFSLGVIAAFGGLALFVITQDALWGKFISHPITAGLLGAVLLIAAAQAFGLFEIVLPRAITNLEAMTDTHSYGSSSTLEYGRTVRMPTELRKLAAQFFSGLLIAVLSTPCTIGIFAAVIAVAIASGALLGSLTLMFVGVGMALPWFALSAFPEVTARFPRTGPWPSIVKQMMGFLLIGTAIFFVQPLMPQTVRDIMWWLIFACVAASAIFLMVRTLQVAPRPRPLAIASVVSAVWVGIGLAITLALST